MSKTIKRTVRFGVIELRKDNKPVEIDKVFSFIESLKFTSGDRYYKTSDGVNLGIILHTNDKAKIQGILGDSRKEALPMVETKGNLKGLNLENKDSGIFDGIHFYIFINQYNKIIIAYEFNIYAPRIGRLSQYIMAKCENFVDYCAINPVEKQNLTDELKRIKEPRAMKIKAHNSCSFQILDKSLDEAFKTIRDTTDADFLEIGFTCRRGRKDKLEITNYNRVGQFMQTRDAIDLLEHFYITHKKDGQIENIDLTNLFLHNSVEVFSLEKHRSVDSKSMYHALDESIKKYYSVLQGIQE